MLKIEAAAPSLLVIHEWWPNPRREPHRQGAAMKKSRTVPRPTAVESPRHLPLVDLLVEARVELFEPPRVCRRAVNVS